MTKNRDREKHSFANINFLGKCNVDCFFCLGKDIEKELSVHNQLCTPVLELPNFHHFLDRCKGKHVKKLYINPEGEEKRKWQNSWSS